MSTEDDARAPGEGQEPAQDPAPAAAAAPAAEPEAPVEHFQAEPAAVEESPVEDVATPVAPEAPAVAVLAPEAAAVSGAEAVHAESVVEDEHEHEHEEEDDEPVGSRAKSEMVEIGKTIFFALLIAFVLRVVLFQPFTIPSASMEPNLYQGDYIIVTKWSYGYSHFSIPFSPPIFKNRIFTFLGKPQRGDIVVFRLPRQPRIDYIKRLIGLPGDTIQMRDNQLYINGKPTVDLPKGPAVADDAPPGAEKVQETLPNKKTILIQDFGPNQEADNTAVYTVPAGCYFMMGDNRDNSVDSRFDPQIPAYGDVQNTCGWDAAADAALGPGAREAGVGFVPAENLIGKAQIIMFSWYPGASLWNPISWFSKVRFSRFLHTLH
jgi:signal peptidase I